MSDDIEPGPSIHGRVILMECLNNIIASPRLYIQGPCHCQQLSTPPFILLRLCISLSSVFSPFTLPPFSDLPTIEPSSDINTNSILSVCALTYYHGQIRWVLQMVDCLLGAPQRSLFTGYIVVPTTTSYAKFTTASSPAAPSLFSRYEQPPVPPSALTLRLRHTYMNCSTGTSLTEIL